jgi:hypothetical protein
MILIHLRVIAHARPGEADQLPADHIDVAAVLRIAEHSFNGVAPQ